MVIKIIIIFLLLSSLSADIYKENCVECHRTIPVSIDKYFYRYLLKYSSETDVKKAMREYLLNPQKEKSVMAEAFISRFGVKRNSSLNDEELKDALDTYWEKYKLFGKLK